MASAGQEAPSQKEADDEVGFVEQDVLVGNCTTAPADLVLATNTQSILNDIPSPTTYGHPGCPFWVVDFDVGPAIRTNDVMVQYDGPPLSDDQYFPCEAKWSRLKVLIMPLGRVLSDQTVQARPASQHQCWDLYPSVKYFGSMTPGKYRLLLEAGLTTAFEPVRLYWSSWTR